MARTPKSTGMLSRRKASKEALKRILIVCEGTKTEPTYFRDMISSLELASAQVDVEPSTSTCPANLVQYAERRKREEAFDSVYCVFDKDTHEHFDEAINRLDGFKNRKVPVQILAIYSIPCFELWLLLHKKHSDKPYLTAADLIRELKKLPPFEAYEKAKSGVYMALLDDLPMAIKNSKKLDPPNDGSKLSNPSTKVYELVEVLLGLSKDQDELLGD
ncbi:hypothetical protein J2777_003295 [Paraburkholderia graminis]|uniref:RloB family protein n=1 Tax=Paraburkholderia graminis TaxID=60548 RepID=UPI00285CCFB9|nr:RloB family protein [Paraburkholderia graminis]MDR6469567.1 hypothetical protein [Paraburkholderia graminis]